jgi:hypothetical protein
MPCFILWLLSLSSDKLCIDSTVEISLVSCFFRNRISYVCIAIVQEFYHGNCSETTDFEMHSTQVNKAWNINFTSPVHDFRPNKYHSTGYTQKNGVVSKVNKKFISHLTRAQHTPSAAATVQFSHALPAVRFSCLLHGPGASFKDGIVAGEGFLHAPFWGVQICDYSAAWVSCTVSKRRTTQE